MKEMAYVGHFCITPEPLKPLVPRIINTEKPSSLQFVRHGWNADRILGASLICAITLGTSILLSPLLAEAFWPFSVTNAQDREVVQHDTGINLLKAAGNPDPNPFKGSQDVTTTEGSALIAQAGIDGTVGETLYHPDSGSISSYVVRSGDTLSEIAAMFEVSSNTILWANGLKSAKDVHPGMTLTILPVSGVSHTVVKGETLASLAKKFGADADDIASFNGIDGTLAVGSTVIIPGGELATPKAKTVASIKTGGSAGAVKAVGSSLRVLDGFFTNPVPGSRLNQGIHGWNGVDLGAPVGTTIHAAADGKVIVSRNSGWNGGYGNYVVVDHGNGTQTLYAHMSTVSVSVGSSVSKGDAIGAIGMTGKTTGAHLHFEVRGAKNPFAK